MTIYIVQIWVKPGCEEKFIAATEENHIQTRQEPGNLRFDLLRSPEKPEEFTLYEVYTSPDAVSAHKETPHYHAWREQVEPFMARKRSGRQWDSLLPLEEKLC